MIYQLFIFLDREFPNLNETEKTETWLSQNAKEVNENVSIV